MASFTEAVTGVTPAYQAPVVPLDAPVYHAPPPTTAPKCTAGAIATWDFGKLALDACIPVLQRGQRAMDAVETGIRAVEADTAGQYYVGRGGLPNAEGFMEFDAAVMDHRRRYGAVLSVPNVLHPVSVARSVLEKCVHNVLTGQGALKWAMEHGFQFDDTVLTEDSRKEWKEWKEQQKQAKQPIINSVYDPCGTGIPSSSTSTSDNCFDTEPEPSADKPHDTVCVICRDQTGQLAVGTSTSGWRFKHLGRVGDAPLVGSGLYCDGRYGAAAATGDGEEIMRSCLSFLVVEKLREGHSVQEACRIGIERLLDLERPGYDIAEAPGAAAMYPRLTAAVIAMDKDGNMGAASTLDIDNLHRGNPFFPAITWRESEGIQALPASFDGAQR